MLTQRGIKKLGVECRTSATTIRDTFVKRRIVIDEAHIAWGQFLDDDRAPQQYGVYGTAAGLNVLLDSGYGPTDSIVTNAQASLPFFGDHEAVTENDAGDVASTFKVAAVLDATESFSMNLYNLPPAAVQLIAAHIPQRGWGDYYIDEAHRDQISRTIPTMIALMALRRVTAFSTGESAHQALQWLSAEVMSTKHPEPLLDALYLLTQNEYQDQGRAAPEMRNAQRTCQERLAQWCKDAPTDTFVHAEYHYSMPNDHDRDQSRYVFYPLYAVVALARLQNGPRSPRWPYKISQQIADRVNSRGGYEISGRIATVDQMWAYKLLTTCADFARDSPERLLTGPLSQVSKTSIKIVVAAVLLVLAMAGVWASLSGIPIGFRAGGAILAALAAPALIATGLAWFGGADHDNT